MSDEYDSSPISDESEYYDEREDRTSMDGIWNASR